MPSPSTSHRWSSRRAGCTREVSFCFLCFVDNFSLLLSSLAGEHIKNWRLRYFVLLEDGSLRGFKKKPEGGNYQDPMNDFTVRGCQIMKTDRPKPFIFIMRGLQWTSVIERTFQANNEQERSEWMAAIGMVTQSLPPLDVAVNDVEMAEEAKQDGTGLLDFFGGGGGKSAGRHPLHITSQQSHKGRRIQLDNFEYLKVLGKGTFGKVGGRVRGWLFI